MGTRKASVHKLFIEATEKGFFRVKGGLEVWFVGQKLNMMRMFFIATDMGLVGKF